MIRRAKSLVLRTLQAAAAALLCSCGIATTGTVSGPANDSSSGRACVGHDLDLLTQIPARGDGHPKRSCRETLAFFEPFAAMAAIVYDPRDRTDEQLSNVAGSSWLLKEIVGTDEQTRADMTHQLLDAARRTELYAGRIRRKCNKESADWTSAAGDSAVRAAQGECRQQAPGKPSKRAWYDILGSDDGDDATVDTENAGYKEAVPESWEQCEYGDADDKPAVPIRAMTVDWEIVPELQRRLHPRGWSIFVPGLVIDVWRRKRLPQGESPVVEYTFVFRGTADRGGWLSNFRALTAFTPLVWDQYRQAQRTTIDLVNQVYMLHALSDALFGRRADTRINITAVGHSLGGGLAQYVFLRIPQITRVVAFDPSPVNGSTMFAPEALDERMKQRGWRDRESVLGKARQPLDRTAYDEQASIFVLYESGDALTAISGCTSGPVWGAEGGPVVRCDSVNLSGGSAFRQHNMAQLACKVDLALRGLRTRPPPMPRESGVPTDPTTGAGS